MFLHAASPEAPAEVTGRLMRPNILDWDRRHPLPAVREPLERPGHGDADGEGPSWGRALAEGESGPLLVAGEKGGTRSIYLGFNPVVPTSDFCLKVAFPIFISNCVGWLSEHPGRGETLQVRAGEVAPIDVPGDAKQVRVTDPTGRRVTRAGREPAARTRSAVRPDRPPRYLSRWR